MQWKFDESHLSPAVRKYNQFLRDTGLMNDPIPIGPGVMKGPIGNVSRKLAEAAMRKFNQGMTKWFEKTGGMKQWLRLGKSYSIKGSHQVSKSLRWGASPKHANKIGNSFLRRVNQWLRNKKLPGKSWRVRDPGHFHIKK